MADPFAGKTGKAGALGNAGLQAVAFGKAVSETGEETEETAENDDPQDEAAAEEKSTTRSRRRRGGDDGLRDEVHHGLGHQVLRCAVATFELDQLDIVPGFRECARLFEHSRVSGDLVIG